MASSWTIHSPRKIGGLFNNATETVSSDCSKYTTVPTMPDVFNTPILTCDDSVATDAVQNVHSPTEESTFDLFPTLDSGDVDLDQLLEYEIFTDLNNILDMENAQQQQQQQEEEPVVDVSDIIGYSAAVSDVLASCADDLDLSTVDYAYLEPSADDCTDELVELSNDDVRHIQYLERRRKNNAASKKSRECKKRRFVDMEDQAITMERDNMNLKRRIVELERLVGIMKSGLVKAVATSNSS